MNLGALLDLGVSEDFLRKELSRLPLGGYELVISKDMRKGISGTRVEVKTHQQFDHDHPADDHDHDHDHSGTGHHHHVHQHHAPHRKEQHHDHNSFGEIKKMILDSGLAKDVKDLSLSIFEKVAIAEAKIHNKAADDVHFHEVGAVDSIVDIVGAAICIKALAPDRIIASTVELGGGFIQCAHGTYPVPAPATAEIIRDMPVRKGTVPYEATTPTGAAILSSCVEEFTDSFNLRIRKTGYGIGHKDGPIPNVLRVHWCEAPGPGESDTNTSVVVECNIDDMNPEYYDYVIELLFEAGAKDVYITPIIMKKSRPAVTLSVLVEQEAEVGICEILFRETSTLGIRRLAVGKVMLQRKMDKIETPFGAVRVKTAYFNQKKIKSKPEYEDCVKIAREKKIPLNQVYRQIEKLLD
jgi:hypothetical protein